MKMGLEIHQRIATKRLFCRCPSILAEGKDPAVVIDRRLHPVYSELGEIDRASMAEFEKSKVFEYQAFEQSNCLVELDEEPPFPLNRDALKAALEIALHLNAKIVDEIHVMRKIVIDGSNTTGFQRTAIVGFNGYLDTNKGKVRIPLVAIEEESAGIVETKHEKTVYRLDRLGIPLVEISTDPSIKDGEHLREVAEKIGLILRTTGKVARGLGTIRQDVNISTEKGARVEIKGAQDLRQLPTLVKNEIARQENLVSIIEELKKRKAYPVKSKPVDITEAFKKTDSKLVKKEMEMGGMVLGLKLPKHIDMLGKELQPGRRYGTELSDYAKHAGVKGIIHSDEDLKTYKFSEREISKAKEMLSAGENDAFVIAAATPKKAEAALAKVLERANMDYVPEETRRVNRDGTTSYLRPLPGRARMYPETDVPPVLVDEKLLRETKKGMGESYEEKKESLEKLLNKEMAGRMLRSKHLKLFEKLVAEGIDPMLAANTIENTIVSLRREGFEIKDTGGVLTELFSEYKKGKFVKAAIPEILKKTSKRKGIGEVLKDEKLKRISGKELEKIAEENGFDIKGIMSRYRLRVDPAELMRIIRKKKK
jgi:glutamyl-tRNA(Gln) amidotransferase subunit E